MSICNADDYKTVSVCIIVVLFYMSMRHSVKNVAMWVNRTKMC